MKEKHNASSEEEREEMMDFFNSNLENLGDTLFGEDSTPEDLATYVDGLDDTKSEQFVNAVNEAMDFDNKWLNNKLCVVNWQP